MHEPRDEFSEIIQNGYEMNPHTEVADPYPYGIPAQPVKPGLTKRGKAAIAIGTAVIAGGGLLGYQHYSAVESANETRAQELQIQREQIELEKLKEMNKAQATTQKVQFTQNAALQKQIDACVNNNKGLVGKQLGATLESVIKDCQTQYQTTTSSGDMTNAAAATDAPSSSGGGVSPGLLIGGAVLAGGLVVAVRKSTRSNQT
jgi:hypothetical protein